jgi:hypothetical protein
MAETSQPAQGVGAEELALSVHASMKTMTMLPPLNILKQPIHIADYFGASLTPSVGYSGATFIV